MRYDELVSNIREYEPGERERLSSVYHRDLSENQQLLLFDLVLRSARLDKGEMLSRNNITDLDLGHMLELGVIQGSQPGSIVVDEPFVNWIVEGSVQ